MPCQVFVGHLKEKLFYISKSVATLEIGKVTSTTAVSQNFHDTTISERSKVVRGERRGLKR